MKNLVTFYQLFYGFEFYRYFTRPPDFRSKQFRIQFTVKNPKQLYLHVHHNNGFHPCYISIYDYSSKHNLNNKKNPELIVFDRVYFDFDVHNPQVDHVKNNLKKLMSHGLYYQEQKQDQLKEQLRNLIINDKIVEPAINQAKEFVIKFNESFGSYPLLFFSGCKGAHAYTFFEPVKLEDINRTLLNFVEDVKNAFNYQYMDLSVYGSLNSRVPYSKHQYTNLAVVPFQIKDSYDTIMEKSLNPVVESFNREHYFSIFGKYLQKNDAILEHNKKIKKTRMRTARICMEPSSKRVVDHREWFKSILGEPAYESSNKPYVMYNCPFPDHEDHKPSFMVYPTGYHCKGCGRKGNYFQFLKDMNGWTNKQVKNYLKSVIIERGKRQDGKHINR